MHRFIRKPRGIGLGALSLVCVACTTLGPDYQQPTTPWLQSWQPELYGKLNPLNAKDEQLGFWWHALKDEQLNALMQRSLAANLDLQQAGLRVLQARAQLGIAGSTLYPQLQQVSGSIAGAKTRSRGGILPDSDDSVFSYQSGIDVGWELDFWGKFSRGIEAADAGFFSSIANQQNMQVIISSQVAQLYFTYKTTEQRIVIAHENAKIQKRSYEITQKLYLQGQQAELDLQQAKSQYLATLSTIPTLEILLTKTRNSLSTILAQPPGPIAELQSEQNTLPIIETILLNEIPANIILRRPDVRSSAWLVAAQSAQIGIAEADYYPSISLFGTLSWSGNSNGNSSDNGLLSTGAGFNWNVLDYGRIENNILLQDARLQERIEQYQANVLNAAREIDDAAISVVKTLEKMDIYDASVTATQRALVLANARFKEGYSDFQRVLDAQRAYFNQTNQRLINRGDHISAVITLYKSLGGGWHDMPIDGLISNSTKQQLNERQDWQIPLSEPLPKSPKR